MNLKDLINFKDSQFIFDVLFKNDKTARFIGGCVRDTLFEREVTDIDIGTVLHPDEVEKVFSKYPNVKVIDIGKEYGTVMVVVNHHTFEITTLRKDVHTDGRYAVVEYTDDWEEDASRRDFTINGMSYSPQEDKLYDYFNGQVDLKAWLIKFIGVPHKRVEEDYLRILRLFRFYTYYGKTIDPASFAACKKYAKHMDRLSQERKMGELYRILLHEEYMETLELMEKNEILEHVSVLPDWHSGIQLCKRLEKLCSNYGYSFTNEKDGLPRIEAPRNDEKGIKENVIASVARQSMMLKIFALFYKENLSSAQIAKEFITLSKEEKKYLTSLSRFVGSVKLNDITAKLHYFFYYYREVLTDGFLYLQAKESQEDENKFKKIISIVKQEISVFPLTGSDVMSRFSLKPGKALGKLLEMAKDFWIESEFKASKESILTYIKQHINN